MNAQELHVEGGTKHYPIYLRDNDHGELIERVIPLVKNNQVCVLSDERVSRLYAAQFSQQLAAKGIESTLITVDGGERAKSLGTAEAVYQKLVDANADRETLLIAYGGGVIGDLGGFVAATFMRGMPFVQIPTTVLALVDSSIGGKVGINLPQGKNLVGSFYEPEFVWADTQHLETLRPRDVRNGLSEAVKHGLIHSESILQSVSEHRQALLSGDPGAWLSVLPEIMKVKLDLVQRDFRENNVRRHLNFGHTLAHAIESVDEYRRFNHGEAVAIGMRAMLRMSELHQGLDAATVIRVEHLFDALGFPNLSRSMLETKTLSKLRTDKKKSGNLYRLILLSEIGQPCTVECDWNETLRRFGSVLTHPLMEA
jgi:3-dehydroquinate synthase